jgi:hypothetical protein
VSDDDDEQPSPGGMVIHLFGPPPAVEGAPRIDRDSSGLCAGADRVWHPHSPVVDKVARTVSCGVCKRALDPIDVLLEVAGRHEQWKRLTEEVRTMRGQLATLRDEETRTRARTKAHSRKDAVEAVEAERARHDRGRQIIAFTTDEVRRALDKIDRQIGRLPIRKGKRK